MTWTAFAILAMLDYSAPPRACLTLPFSLLMRPSWGTSSRWDRAVTFLVGTKKVRLLRTYIRLDLTTTTSTHLCLSCSLPVCHFRWLFSDFGELNNHHASLSRPWMVLHSWLWGHWTLTRMSTSPSWTWQVEYFVQVEINWKLLPSGQLCQCGVQLWNHCHWCH